MRERSGLITSAELADIIDRPDLRLFDCTTYLEPAAEAATFLITLYPDVIRTRLVIFRMRIFWICRANSPDQGTDLRFMMPKVAQLEAAFGRHGIGANSKVVLYSIGTPMWATRFWWMLKSLGFDNAFVLDGGFDKWKAEGRAIESGPAKGYQPAIFTAKPRSGYFVGKKDVLAARDDRNTVVVNALGPQFHKGLEPSRYGRPGRIPGSCNVSAATLLDPRPRLLCRSRTPK